MVSELTKHCNTPPERLWDYRQLDAYDGEHGVSRFWVLRCTKCGKLYEEWFEFTPYPRWG